MKRLSVALTVIFFISLLMLGLIEQGEAAPGEPKYGGTLKIRCSLPMDVGFGDPTTIFGPFTMRASISLERLMLPGGKPGEYEYQLATGYKLAPDKSYYEMSLRKGVKFHDGTPFNADAVKWNLERGMEAKKAELAGVSSIAVLDDHTLRLNLSSWSNDFLSGLTHDCGYMISPAAFKANGKDWANFHPIGTGPFVFKGIKANQIVQWEKNPDYWDKGLPYLDAIEFHYIPDHTVTGLALKAGEVDGSWEGADYPTQLELAKDPKKWLLWNSDTEFAGVLYMNSQNPESVWHDVRMRQAFEYALDKETIINTFGEIPFSYPLYTIIKGIEESVDLTVPKRMYDPDKARELIKAAGHGDGVDFTLYLSTENHKEHKDVFLAYQEGLKAVGLRADIQVVEVATGREISSKPLPGNSVYYAVLRGNKVTPSAVIIESLSEGSMYMSGVARPSEWPALLKQARSAEDISTYLSTLGKMNDLAYEQAMFIPSHLDPLVSICRTYVKDWVLTREGQRVARTWLDK